MKIYMLKMTRLDGEHAYRASGVYDTWTQSGKCWSRVVVQIDLKQNKIDEIPFICWYSANMKKVGDV